MPLISHLIYLHNDSADSLFLVVQLLSDVRLFGTLWTVAHQASLSISNSTQTRCPLSRPSHPTASYSVIPFSSCLRFFLAWGSFPVSQSFTSGGQSIGVSALASVLPMNIQDWLPLGWTGWISSQSKGLSRIFSNITVQKSVNSSALSFLYSPTLTSILENQ